MARRTPARLAVALALVLAAGALASTATATAMGRPSVAALQVALKSRGLYPGTIDGIEGNGTATAIRRLQSRSGLATDGVVGPRTRKALGKLGRHPLGSRPLRAGKVGRDVAALQFLLAWHGFPSGDFDGVFGPRLGAALRRFQTWARLPTDGVAGPATLAALHRRLPRCPLALAWPLRAPVGDGFGPRSDRFHAGIDIPAGRGTHVAAARAGRVIWAGWADGGWGNLVELQHEDGVATLYAHLSHVDVRVGEQVRLGALLGRVGATGDATGPHLHFEVRARGASVNPLEALP